MYSLRFPARLLRYQALVLAVQKGVVSSEEEARMLAEVG